MPWIPTGASDSDAIHDNVAGEIAALTAVTPVTGDWVLIEDASDSDNKKKVNASHFLDGGGGGGGGGIFEGVPVPDGGTRPYVIPDQRIQNITAAGLSGGADQVNYAPIIIREAIHVDEIVAEVTSGTSANVARIALYEATFDLQPTNLIAQGEFSVSTTGVKSVVVDQTLPPGRYLTAIHGASNPAYRLAQTSTSALPASSNNRISNLRVARTYSALPDPGVVWDTMIQAASTFSHHVFLSVSQP